MISIEGVVTGKRDLVVSENLVGVNGFLKGDGLLGAEGLVKLCWWNEEKHWNPWESEECKYCKQEMSWKIE